MELEYNDYGEPILLDPHQISVVLVPRRWQYLMDMFRAFVSRFYGVSDSAFLDECQIT